jgi:hypothetical protein
MSRSNEWEHTWNYIWQTHVKLPQKLVKAQTYRPRGRVVQLTPFTEYGEYHSMQWVMGLCCQLCCIITEEKIPHKKSGGSLESTYRLSRWLVQKAPVARLIPVLWTRSMIIWMRCGAAHEAVIVIANVPSNFYNVGVGRNFSWAGE